MASTVHRRVSSARGPHVHVPRICARARALATTAYPPDRAGALVAMHTVARTAASALSARSQRSCLRSQRTVCAISMQCTFGPGPGTDFEILDSERAGGRVRMVQHSSFTFVWGVFRVETVEKSPPDPPVSRL